MKPSRDFPLNLLRASLLVAAALLAACGGPPDDLLERSRTTPDWYDEGKLGIFIHWGPASVPAFASGGALQPGELERILLHGDGRRDLPYVEWYQYGLAQPGSPVAQHHAAVYGAAPYTDFGPEFESRVAAGWDPDAWAALFERAGARYVVLVTKHHDGYTLWPSEVENPHLPGWGAQRDMVGDLARAVRARGMRFGIYYSTGLDWTFQLVAQGDLVRDMLLSAPGDRAFGDYTYDQVRELIDRYRPAVLWADIGYPSSGRRDELLAYYFEQVPDGVVNDRWGAVDRLGGVARLPGGTALLRALGRWLTAGADPLADDPARIGFKTAEYDSLPGIAPYRWEATRGLGASFAYNAAETADDMLDAAALVRFLVDTVAKNGNVLINVGPDSHGGIPAIQRTPLEGLGQWLAVNGEAVYGTRPWRRHGNLSGRELRYTLGPRALYAVVFGEVGSSLRIEDPGVEWDAVSVLGGEVVEAVREEGTLRLELAAPLDGPAAVVRFALPAPGAVAAASDGR